MSERAVLFSGGAVADGSFKSSVIFCNVCQRSFNHKGNFLKHYRTHTGEKPFPCPKCPYKATQKAHLSTHILARHGDSIPSCSQASGLGHSVVTFKHLTSTMHSNSNSLDSGRNAVAAKPPSASQQNINDISISQLLDQ